MVEQKGSESIFTKLALLIGGFAGENCRTALGVILGLTVFLLPFLDRLSEKSLSWQFVDLQRHH